MNRIHQILEHLREELGFSPPLVGGEKFVLTQIEHFLVDEGVPDDLDPKTQPRLWNRLISRVVVPETSFFRYPESFAALQQWARSHPHRRLRVLCAPCSTGEEAYSLAITLREAGVVNFSIEALDASIHSIGIARAAHYPSRSIRGLPKALQAQWFHEDGAGITAADQIRRSVSFHLANIFACQEPPQSFDVIFCRNLLIYFDPANQRRTFELLNHWLKPDGLLFLGPGEATIAAAHGWTSTGFPMSFSFTRATSPAPAPTGCQVRKPPPLHLRKTGPTLRSLPPRESRDASAPPTIENWMARATELADSGDLDAAEDALLQFHASHASTVESLLLRAIIEDARGDRTCAEASYRQALYLEPDHLETLLHLSALLESAGRSQAAVLLRRRISRLSAAP